MPLVIAKVAQEYPFGVKRAPGDKFEVEAEHVKLLEALGRIGPDESPVEEAAQEPRQRRSSRKAA